MILLFLRRNGFAETAVGKLVGGGRGGGFKFKSFTLFPMLFLMPIRFYADFAVPFCTLGFFFAMTTKTYITYDFRTFFLLH
jgi:hypothetical protein